MKKLLMMALMAVCMTANAEEIEDVNVVNGTHEMAAPADKKKGKSETDIVLRDGENDKWTMHLGVGVNLVTGAPDAYEFAPFKSWDIQWTVVQYDYTPKNAKQTYSIGLGLNWRNYGLKDNGTAFLKAGDVVGLAEFPNNAGSRYSSVQTLAINVPLLFTQKVSKDVSITVGPIVNFNAGGWVKRSFELGDDEYDVSTRKIGQAPVTVDVFGMVDIDGFGLFCKYSPMKVFKKDRGPEFNSVTLGLYF